MKTDSIREALGLFPSCIISGERWTDRCEDVKQAALQEVVAIERAREIAAQPGEVDLAVAIASALADFDGMDEASLHTLRWSYGAQPEPMGDAWCMDYLPRGEAIARLLAARPSPPHVADALDGGRLDFLHEKLRGIYLYNLLYPHYDLAIPNLREAIDKAIAARAEAGDRT